MSNFAEATYLSDNGYALSEHATIGTIGNISVAQANHELEQVHFAKDPADAYLEVLTAHDVASGEAFSSVMDMVHGYNEMVPGDVALPVAAILRNTYSGKRTMAMVGLLRRVRPFDALVMEDADREQGICMSTAALSLDGYMQAVSGETNARGSKPGEPGRAFIDVMRYVPTTGSELVHVGHKTAIAVAAGEEVTAMLEAHKFSAFGRFAFGTLGISRTR